MPTFGDDDTAYHVIITMRQVHHFNVRANSPAEAQAKALEEMGDRAAERWETNVEVERGVR